MKEKTIFENITLLLIDDDPNIILLVKDYLQFRGYEVLTATNGKEALNIVSQKDISMIICDIMMPEMDGYTFVTEIRQNLRTQWIPVMFLSAKGQSQDRIKGLNIGADIYMVKPFEPEELVAQIESTLKHTKRLTEQHYKKGDNTPIIQVPGNVELTVTETKVVSLVAQGLSNRDIAQNLQVSQRTIESHVSNMLNKTGLHNRTELAMWVKQNNLA
jgi:DNA-binding NarL/FixJ family response regulator